MIAFARFHRLIFILTELFNGFDSLIDRKSLKRKEKEGRKKYKTIKKKKTIVSRLHMNTSNVRVFLCGSERLFRGGK